MFRLYLFGSPVLTKDGEQINIRRRRGRALFAYLALQERSSSRESLAALFWPEYDQSTAFANLRRELARLKVDIGEGVITADRQTIAIDPEAQLWLDVTTFEAGIGSEEIEELAQALTLYTNDFLAGFTLADCPQFDEWQFFQSENLKMALSGGLQRFIAVREAAAAYEEAIGAARRWLLLDTLHEPAHRALMRLYTLAGQLSAAIRQYHICVQTMETELGLEPEAETTALLEAIQTRQIGPTAAPEIEFDQTAETVEEVIPVVRHNLPSLPDSFIGRSREIKKIHHYLTETDCRLLTIRGMGGIGKTRLALEAVGELVESDHFPDGLFFVSLAGVESAAYLVSAVAATVQFPLSQATDPLDQLINFLRSREILLFLDNFEHLTDAADQLSFLLQHCPHLKLLVTSRHQLNVLGEYLLRLEGLPLTAGRQSDSSATRLFADRAIQLAPQLDLKIERPFIRTICRLVEGLPLAIEMCAAWVQTLNCQEILAEIQHGLDLLEANRADAPTRHLSIRAVFQSSFNLLNDSEQRAMLALSVFRGSFNYTAAQEVVGASILQLRGLVEKSMLDVLSEAPETRYQIHSLLRQFAEERIEPEPMRKRRWQHAIYYANLLAALWPKRTTAEYQEVFSTVFAEVDNLRSVWGWLGRQIGEGQADEQVCKLVEQLLPVWSFAYSYKTYYLEAKQQLLHLWQSMVVANWGEGENGRQRRTQAIVSAVLARFCLELGQFDEADDLSQQAYAVLNQARFSRGSVGSFEVDKDYLAYALRSWGAVKFRVGDLNESERLLIESLEVATADITKAQAMQSLGTLFSNQGKYEVALSYLVEAILLFEACHDQIGLLAANIAIGAVYGRQRNFEEAIPRFREVVRLARKVGQKSMLMMALNNLAIASNLVGRTGMVKAYFEEALALAKDIGNQRWQAMIEQDFGRILLDSGQVQMGGELIRSGLQLATKLHSQPDVLSALVSMAHWQAQNGRFVEALVALGYIVKSDIATVETQDYAADLWGELSSELPAIFTLQAQTKLRTFSLDDILSMMSP